ncbi:MAG: efflux RND transporter periplasmic adaptor subunit [candidate division WOR-3 bacterium]
MDELLERRKALAVCGVGLVLLLVVACRPQATRETAPVQSEGLKVRVQEMVPGPIENRLVLSGVLAPARQVAVLSKLPGRLVSIEVKEGQSVKENEVIAQVNQEQPGLDYRNLQVTAPISGVVGKVMLDPGSMVSPATPIAVVLDIDELKVTVNVIESEIGLVRNGLRADIEVPAWPGRKFRGAVSNVLPIVDPLSHTAKTEITIANSGHVLKPGMSATVSLLLSRQENAIAVPKDAVIEKLGEKYVYLYEDGKVRRVNVTTGFDDGKRIQIIAGVQAGDTLITSDLNVLKDGSRVRVRERTDKEADAGR